MNNFELIVLGSGAMVPSKDKNPAGFLVKTAGKSILLDAGHGTIRRLTDLDTNIQNIDYVFISHFHTDHFGDAFNLVHSRWVDDIYSHNKHKKLIFWCPHGTKSRFKLWRKIFWKEPDEKYPVEFREGSQQFKIKDIQIELFPVKHVKWFSSLGVIMKYKGKKLVYTGDIGSGHSFSNLVKITKDADLLITEASYEIKTPNHYTVNQIKELTNKANIKKVLVVHIRPQYEKRVKKICQKEPKFIFGKDKSRIKI